MESLQQIGSQHPRVKQIRHLISSSAPGHRQLLVAEGPWAHDVLLDLDAAIEVFLWCPEAAYSPGAPARAARLAARAACAYRVSARVLDRLCERDRPDGMVSLVALPAWEASRIKLQAEALVLVADAIEIPGNLGTLLRTLDACGAMHGRADSLNVSVSASILLYDIRARRDDVRAGETTHGDRLAP
jgi:TrmH family RNA methyltransferase